MQWLDRLLGRTPHADEMATILETDAQMKRLRRIREARGLVFQARAVIDEVLDAPTASVVTTTTSVRLFSAMLPVKAAVETNTEPSPAAVEMLRQALKASGNIPPPAVMRVGNDAETLLRQADELFDRCDRVNRLDLMGEIADTKRALQQAIAIRGASVPMHFVEDLRNLLLHVIDELVPKRANAR
jgi:hypothetical protein